MRSRTSRPSFAPSRERLRSLPQERRLNGVTQTVEDLPLVDEHEIVSPASADRVWESLLDYVGGIDSVWTRAYAHLVGADPRDTKGTLPSDGSAVPGFAVTQATPGRRLVLAGRHWFSRYGLIFDLAERPDGTVLRAQTRAEFPGIHGRAYRLLVIDSGIHRVLVRRILRGIAR